MGKEQENINGRGDLVCVFEELKQLQVAFWMTLGKVKTVGAHRNLPNNFLKAIHVAVRD